MELNVGRGGDRGDLRPVLVGGVLRSEDEGDASHSDWGWERGFLDVGHEFGEDLVPNDGAGDGVTVKKEEG